jgi:hypothetical protein
MQFLKIFKLCGAKNEKAVGQCDHALLQNGGGKAAVAGRWWRVFRLIKNGLRSIFLTVNTECIPFLNDLPIP